MNVSRTTNKIHFDDLSDRRFEDLCLQVIYRHKLWEEIHHDGRLGADRGSDIRAIERIENGAIRYWCIQCKRVQKLSASGLKTIVDEVVRGESRSPEVILAIVACDVTIAARESFEKHARKKGIEKVLVWSASLLEAKLYSDYRDLLFAFFGVSLAKAERQTEIELETTLRTKRKVLKVFRSVPELKSIIVRSISDTSYPSAEESEEELISSWFRVFYYGQYHNGIEVLLQNTVVAIEDLNEVRSSKWTPVDLGEDVEYQFSSDTHEPQKRFSNSFKYKSWDLVDAMWIGRIPYRNIVNVDELGDGIYDGPFLFCRFADGGEPYEKLVYKVGNTFYLEDENRVRIHQ